LERALLPAALDVALDFDPAFDFDLCPTNQTARAQTNGKYAKCNSSCARCNAAIDLPLILT
jgi:hypothetical protein